MEKREAPEARVRVEPATRRSQRSSARARHDPRLQRHILRCEVHGARGRFDGLPIGPSLHVMMAVWRPIDVLSSSTDDRGDFAVEIPVIYQATLGQEVPEDLVRLRPPCSALVHEEHEAIPRLRVELQEVRNVLPSIQGLIVGAALDDRPEGRRVFADLEAELPLEVPVGLGVEFPDAPEGIEGHVVVVLVIPLVVSRIGSPMPSATEALAFALASWGAHGDLTSKWLVKLDALVATHAHEDVRLLGIKKQINTRGLT